mmetsp:Transcript_5844/g.12299  ORF Transcript_5844/g.12299 Transcript_5844/m.12299 type:complete len:250 (-) Transcript_5844:970-1719(-)
MPGTAAGSGFGVSTMRHSVVSTMAAMDDAFSSAQIVTLAGSITPDSIRSSYVSVRALYPSPNLSSSTFAATISPSTPAFIAICFTGAFIVRYTISIPAFSSSSSVSAISGNSTFRHCSSADPPPGTIPASIAAFVALSASSYRSFLSFSSVSVAAPTLIRAIPPPRRATRSSPFSRSNCESVAATSFLICSMRDLTASSVSPVEMIVVDSFPTTTLSVLPSISVVTDSSVIPRSSATNDAPVKIAMSSR